LTIVGYSINATIVIFDRIRENLKAMKKEPLEKIVNVSISQTLSRSINTSLTTVIMVIVLFILGVTRSEEHTSELQSRFDLVCRPRCMLFPYTTLFRSCLRLSDIRLMQRLLFSTVSEKT